MGALQTEIFKEQEKMTNKEIVNRDIGLTFDLIRKIIDKPDLADKIPDNSIIEFVEKDFEVKKKSYARNSKLIKARSNCVAVLQESTTQPATTHTICRLCVMPRDTILK